MREEFQRKFRGVVHNFVAGLSGQPSALIGIEVPAPDVAAPEPIPEQADVSRNAEEAPTTPRATRISFHDWAQIWVATAAVALKEEKVDPKDVWALVHCDGWGEPISIATRFRKTVVGAFSSEKGEGAIHCFVRFVDMQKMLSGLRHPDVLITATHLTYSNKVLRDDIPYAVLLEDSVVKPSNLPTDGWITARGMWLALHEAFEFAEPGEHVFGLNAVHVRSLKDNSNQVAVFGVRDTQAYRRVLTVPRLDKTLTVTCRWAFLNAPPNPQEDVLAVKPIGNSYLWFKFPTGLIIGSEMPSLPFPSNTDEFFNGLDGRIDFTPDEVQTLRRALLQAKGTRLDSGQHTIGLTPTKSSLLIKGAEVAEVPARGDHGEEMLFDPELLRLGVAVKDILSLEFKKGDPEHHIRLVGRDVAVVIQPCTQEV